MTRPTKAMRDETLAASVGLAAMRGGFTASDREAMREGVETVQAALKQKVGTATNRRGAVGEAEYDRAIIHIVCAATALVESGAIDEIEVDE